MNSLTRRSLTGFGALALAALAAALPLSAQAQASGKIHVLVFADGNANGILDGSEQRAGGETVLLYRVDDDGKRTLVQTCKTDPTGECVFTEVPYGRYVTVYNLSTGVTIESLPFVLSGANPEVFVRPAPLLPKDRRLGISLLDLGFRNPANALGDAVSRFSPEP